MRVWREIVASFFLPSSRFPWGSCKYDVCIEGEWIGPKEDDTYYRLRECDSDEGEGRGVENLQNFVDVIREFPLVLWVGRMSRQKISRIAQSEGGKGRKEVSLLRRCVGPEEGE